MNDLGRWQVFTLKYTQPAKTGSTGGGTVSQLLQKFEKQPEKEEPDIIEKRDDFIQIGQAIKNNTIDTITPDQINNAQNTYTIYLMPTRDQVANTIVTFFKEYNKLNSENRHIRKIEFHGQLNTKINMPTDKGDVTYFVPRIIIYPVHDRESVEKTLNWLTRIFGNQAGLDLYPGFSEKVTSLIYYHQGEIPDRTNGTGIHAFNPNTGYAFLNTEVFTQQQMKKLGVEDTQKLI